MESSPRIMIIHGDRGVGPLLSVLCEEEGYSVATYHVSTEAVEELEGQGVDAVVIEGQLPDVTGLQMARIAGALHPDIPIIILAGDDQEDPISVKDSLWTVLFRPYDVAMILEVIRSVLQYRKPRSTTVV